MSISNRTHVVRLACQLPCGIEGDHGDAPCGEPAHVAIAIPAERPGAWQMVPVCRSHAEDAIPAIEFGDRIGIDLCAAYAVPVGTFGNYHQFQVRRHAGTDDLYAVVFVEAFGIIDAAGPLTEEEVKAFQAGQEVAWDQDVAYSISEEMDAYEVVWSQVGPIA